MRSATNVLSAAFGATERSVVELFQVTLITSDVYYFANLDRDVSSHGSLGGVTWTAFPVVREEARFGADLRVDDMTIMFANRAVTIAGSDVPLSQLALRGVLNGAEVQIFLTDLTDPSGGVFDHSVWTIQAASADRATVELKLESKLARLVSMTPRRTWQEGCNWALFSTWCTLSRGGYTVYGQVSSGTTTGHLQFTVSSAGVSVPATIPGSWFELGQVIFSTGPDAGIRRTVRVHSASIVNSTAQAGGYDLLTTLPVLPNSGDQVSMVPGCNKSLNQCIVKFGNGDNFGGFPYIPRPETPIGV